MISYKSFDSVFRVGIRGKMYRGGCRHGRLMRVEPILFKQLSVFFLERDLLMDCMLLLDVPSEPVKVAERHAERVESGSPTGEVGIFRGFLVYRSRGAFHLVHDLAEIPGIRNLDKYMHVVEKGIGGMYAATFPCKNPCHPLEHQSFSRCRNRHLASFGNEDEMV